MVKFLSLFLMSWASQPVDVDHTGRFVEKHQGIAAEHRQRAKILSHDTQVELRAKRVDQAHQLVMQKHQSKLDKFNNLLFQNQACEDKLKQFSSSDHSTETLENFGKCT